jgi:membrane protein YqaA with SNARE-associated domain
MSEVIEHAAKPTKDNQKKSDWSLALISFTESAFLPILTDPFLLGMTIAKPKLWLRYTVIAGVASVLGGLLGYLIGALFFDTLGQPIIDLYNMQSFYDGTAALLDKGAFLFTFIGAVTPLPYKLVAILGGVFQINIFAFILASVIGRFGRYLIVAYISYRFGEYALERFNMKIKLATIAIIAGILLYVAMLVL